MNLSGIPRPGNYDSQKEGSARLVVSRSWLPAQGDKSGLKLPTYDKKRVDLAKRAGQPGGWQEVECVQYGKVVTKQIKTFLATYRPAGGVIRVVLVPVVVLDSGGVGVGQG